MSAQSPLTYLVMISLKNQPILLNFFGQKLLKDELNFQMHCYSALDFFRDKIEQKNNQYLGLLSTIYSADGDYDIYGYYSVTKTKVMVVLKQKPDASKYDQAGISQLLKDIYVSFQAQLFNPFGTFLQTNKLSDKFYEKVAYLGQQFSPK